MTDPCMLYMVTWIPSIYPLYVSINIAYMDPSWDIIVNYQYELLSYCICLHMITIWLVVSNMNFIFHFIYGMSTFPLTNSIIFQDGILTTSQILLLGKHHLWFSPHLFHSKTIDFTRYYTRWLLYIAVKYGNLLQEHQLTHEQVDEFRWGNQTAEQRRWLNESSERFFLVGKCGSFLFCWHLWNIMINGWFFIARLNYWTLMI